MSVDARTAARLIRNLPTVRRPQTLGRLRHDLLAHSPGPPELRVTVTRVPGTGVTRVRVFGEVDRDAAPLVSRVLGRASGSWLLLVDLHGVPLVDAAGARALWAAAETARSRGCRLWLVRTGPFVRRTLEICGLGPLLRPETD